MPCRVLYRCEFCNAQPDAATKKGLESQLQELLFGQYVDIAPGNWLIWSGQGIYGRARYACGEHRGELKADLREAYGTLGWHPWAMGPHPAHHHRQRSNARRRLSVPARWSPTV